MDTIYDNLFLLLLSLEEREHGRVQLVASMEEVQLHHEYVSEQVPA